MILLSKRNILIQLDTDAQASTFDRVVAIDSGVDELFTYSNVALDQVQSLVHGAMFTRGPDNLKHTAIFIGGSDVAACEAILEKVKQTFFGPLSVSVMLDANGSNTTAAAAVHAAAKHLNLSQTRALVLGGTGPVGQRAARLLAGQGALVTLASRSQDRAVLAADRINKTVGGERVLPVSQVTGATLSEVQLVIAAGAAGVVLLPNDARCSAANLRVVIDLNAVAPHGIEGVQVADKAAQRNGQIAYGAIGVGGSKMKIHKAAIATLFESNDHILDAESIYKLAEML